MRKLLLLHLFILSFVLFTIHLNAQESFERAYPVGEDVFLFGIAIQQTSDGGYISVSSFDSISVYSEKALLTKFSPKGDIDWAKLYDIESDISVSNLTLLEKDTFALVSRKAETSRILSKFTPTGELIWSQAYNPPNDILDSTHDLLRIEENNGFAIFNSIFKNGDGDLSISFLDSLGAIEQATIYATTGTDTHFSEAQRTTDKGHIVSGFFDYTEYSSFLFKLDSLNNSNWSQSYRTNSETEGLRFSAITSTLDSGYLVVGEKYLLDNNNQLDSHIGFILKVNANGLPQWGKTFQLDALGLDNLYLDNIVTNDDGSFVISGLKRNVMVPDLDLFMFRIHSTGDIDWIKKYSQISAGYQSSFIRTQDNGYAYFSGKRTTVFENRAAPYLAKVDANGVSSCEDTISFFTDTLIVQVDTLIFETKTFDQIEEVAPTVENFNDYQVPVLSLEIPPPFCEDEAIEWTFDANTPGAVSYEWSTGETSDTLVVTEEGMYSVDVRIETDVCYNLCDTAMVFATEPPMVTIIALENTLCEEGEAILSFDAVGASSFLWSDGSVVDTITVNAEDIYSITVSNRCGTATDELDLNCIFVTNECLGIPNVFTPNNDEINDDFAAVIKEECATNVVVRTMRIYNRWGHLIFETMNQQSWDGRYKDMLAPSDVYVYYMEIENTSSDENGGIEIKSGDVTLVR